MQISRGKRVALMVTLVLSALSIMCDMVIIPVAGNIYAEYAETPIGVLNYILSGTSLIAAISSLICGPLMNRFGKKRVFLVSFLLFTVGSTCGDLFSNAYYLAAMRTLCGIGMGGGTAGGVAIIADVFVDESLRSSMMGIYNGGMSILGAALGWVAGIVAMSGWHNVFRIYLIALPIAAAIFFFVPADHHAADNKKADTVVHKSRFPLSSVLLLCVGAFAANMIYCIVYYQVSMIAIEKGITDSSVIGLFSSVNTIGCFAAGLLFGVLYGKLKGYLATISYVLLGVGFALLYAAKEANLITVACALIGLSYGILLTHFYLDSTILVPEHWSAISSSIMVMIISVGSFLSTYFTTGLQALLHKDTITSLIPLTLVILALEAALSLIPARKR